jgi:TDG/mug DNA glycosylase family protein
MSEPPLRKQSFPPYLPPTATRLVLGTLPGDASLHAGQYYAHPRNAFWPLIARLAGCDLPAGYVPRLGLLDRVGIGLWDICGSAERPGSLDQAIRRVQANPLAELLAAAPQITQIGLNGGAAARLWQRLVQPTLPPELCGRLHLVPLPSSSPAHARLTFEEKLTQWRHLISDD